MKKPATGNLFAPPEPPASLPKQSIGERTYGERIAYLVENNSAMLDQVGPRVEQAARLRLSEIAAQEQQRDDSRRRF